MRLHTKQHGHRAHARSASRSEGTTHPILDLQRLAGNAAVTSLLHVQRAPAGASAPAPYNFGRFDAVLDDLKPGEFSRAYRTRRGEKQIERMQALLGPGVKSESRDAVRDVEQATTGLLASIRSGQGDAQQGASDSVKRALGAVWLNTFAASPYGSEELQIRQEGLEQIVKDGRATALASASGKAHELLDLFLRDAWRARAKVAAATGGDAIHIF
jgi:hypothetical protein